MPRWTLALALPALLTASISANEVMSWVPPYGIQNCKNTLNGTYGKYKAKDGLTHIGLQFWAPTNSGGVTFAGPNATDVKWFVDWGKANGVKVLLTIYNAVGGGGWNWPLAVAAFQNNRSAFVKALIEEMDRHGLDGIDLDLEGNALPANANRNEYKTFVNELSPLLKAKGKLLTICTFNNENADNMPDETWFPDWAGKADFIHVMGYEEMYETSPDRTQRYSYQQELGPKAGYQRHQISMGLMGSNSWGGGTCIQHLEETYTKPKEPASICIWDLQLPGSNWKTEAAWAAMAKTKAYVPVSTGISPRIATVTPAARLATVRLEEGRIEFLPARKAGHPGAADAMGRALARILPMAP
jgi:hypothetical protein